MIRKKVNEYLISTRTEKARQETAAPIGAISMAVISYPFNLYIVYPVYFNFMSKDAVLNAYQVILPSVDSIEASLLIFNVPFTFVKGMIDVLITLLIYKPLSPILKGKR